MAPDFRSDPMESPEGHGVARRAWDAYRGGMEKALGPLVRPVAAGVAVDLVGFWVVWHLHGGFEGLQRLGMPRSTIYWNIKKFRTAYGAHPDEYKLAGVKIDPAAYWAVEHKPRNARKR
jgi:hypothetical protein